MLPDQSTRPALFAKSIACLSCRNSHLKCDLRKPICGRCAKSETECIFHQSRRGRRPSKAHYEHDKRSKDSDTGLSRHALHIQTRVGVSDAGSAIPHCMPGDHSKLSGVQESHSISPSNTVRNEFDAFLGPWDGPPLDFGLSLDLLGSCLTMDALQQTMGFESVESDDSNSSWNVDREHLVALFYKHFYPAHPFVLPYRSYLQRLHLVPLSLRLVMQFAGSHFSSTPTHRRTSYLDIDAMVGLETPSLQAVQSLLIAAITYYGRGETSLCHTTLNKARALAFDLKLYDQTAVTLLSQGDLVLEESALRTWWELSNITALTSVFSPGIDFTSNELPESDIYLPCEEKQYNEGNIPVNRRTQQNFFDRSFSGDLFDYSSFAYKIEAARLLLSIHALGTDWWSIDKDRINTVDNSLSNYHLSMPLKKRDMMGNDGSIDETIFAAKILASVAIILMSRPRSNLKASSKKPGSTCTGHLANFVYETSVQQTFQVVQAANTIADTAGIRSTPCTIICHSPFFACAIVLASTVQLPAYEMSEKRAVRESLRERIKLVTNALARMGENWPMAKLVEREIQELSREVLGCSQPPQVASTSTNRPAPTVHGDWPDRFPAELDFQGAFMF